MSTNSTLLANRSRLIASRWTSMICCGVVGGSVITLSEFLIFKVGAPVAEHLALLNPLPLTILLAIPGAAACWFFGRKRWRGFFGLHFFYTYPPLWVATLVG
ncbi:MAG: hypothetical protein V3T70_02280, partial [Phycisphaerae bacterium]